MDYTLFGYSVAEKKLFSIKNSGKVKKNHSTTQGNNLQKIRFLQNTRDYLLFASFSTLISIITYFFLALLLFFTDTELSVILRKLTKNTRLSAVYVKTSTFTMQKKLQATCRNILIAITLIQSRGVIQFLCHSVSFSINVLLKFSILISPLFSVLHNLL